LTISNPIIFIDFLVFNTRVHSFVKSSAQWFRIKLLKVACRKLSWFGDYDMRVLLLGILPTMHKYFFFIPVCAITASGLPSSNSSTLLYLVPSSSSLLRSFLFYCLSLLFYFQMLFFVFPFIFFPQPEPP
jgi:hypothetical protein